MNNARNKEKDISPVKEEMKTLYIKGILVKFLPINMTI